MKDAREKLSEVVEHALCAYGDFDPNAVDSIVGRIVDAIRSRDESGRVGWLVREGGRVYEVIETDYRDSNDEFSTYEVYTKYIPEEEGEDED